MGERFLESLQQRYDELSTQPIFYVCINEDPLKVVRDIKLAESPFVVVYEISEKM